LVDEVWLFMLKGLGWSAFKLAAPSGGPALVAGSPFPRPGTDATFGDIRRRSIYGRLVCGDVEFGKTELALRVTRAAALAGKQVVMVALIVP